MTLSKPSFLKRKTAKHKVGDQELTFYGLPASVLSDMRGMSKPIARAFQTLFTVGSGSRAKAVKSFSNPEQLRLSKQDGNESSFEDVAVMSSGKEESEEAMTVEMSTHLIDQRTKAVDEMVDTFTDEANKYVVGRAIMCSLRDFYPNKKLITRDEIGKFMDGDEEDQENYPGCDVPTLLQLLIGVCKANFSWFAEAEGKFKAALDRKLKAMGGSEEEPLPAKGESST